ncbi:MAG: methionyl-tRNA formyltransferase [Thermodesulfobacteriota bacterium]
MTASASKQKLPERPGIVFMGTPEFALPTLQAIVQHGHRVITVVTQPDRPKGRGKRPGMSPVKKFALERGLEVLQPEKASDPHFCEILRGRQPDLVLVVAFGQLLRQRFLDIPRWGVINIHASLLPAYRGAAPIQRAVLNGETRTGLTVMRLDAGLDTGPILFQEETLIGEDETAGQLHDRLAKLAGDLTIRSLRQMAEHPVEERPQDHERATYAPKLEKEMGLVEWHRSAAQVSAFIRAFDPKPGAFTFCQGKEIKLYASRVAPEAGGPGVPGRVRRPPGGRLYVETGEGMVEIRELQAPGRRRMPAADFLRGFQVEEGIRLGQ